MSVISLQGRKRDYLGFVRMVRIWKYRVESNFRNIAEIDRHFKPRVCPKTGKIQKRLRWETVSSRRAMEIVCNSPSRLPNPALYCYVFELVDRNGRSVTVGYALEAVYGDVCLLCDYEIDPWLQGLNFHSLLINTRIVDHSFVDTWQGPKPILIFAHDAKGVPMSKLAGIGARRLAEDEVSSYFQDYRALVAAILGNGHTGQSMVSNHLYRLDDAAIRTNLLPNYGTTFVDKVHQSQCDGVNYDFELEFVNMPWSSGRKRDRRDWLEHHLAG